MKHKLGRHAPPDRDLDHKFLLEHHLKAQTLPTSKLWDINSQHLDQGQTGTCVGQGWRNFLRCAPIETTAKSPSAFDIYRSAVLLDDFPSNNGEANLPDNDPGMDSGTTVRAGAKAVQNMKRLKSYAWAFTLQPAVEWVLTQGPVVLGTNWLNDMFSPTTAGLVKATGPIEGGHCYLWRGVDTKKGLARCTNSWGNSWGMKGDFFISLKDLEKLILANGEVCTAIQSK